MTNLSEIFEKITTKHDVSRVDIIVIDVVGTLATFDGKNLNKDLEKFYHYLKSQGANVYIGSSDVIHAQTILQKAGAMTETIDAVKFKSDILTPARADGKNIILIDDQFMRHVIHVYPYDAALNQIMREFTPSV